jgi:hypothetical protein
MRGKEGGGGFMLPRPGHGEWAMWGREREADRWV